MSEPIQATLEQVQEWLRVNCGQAILLTPAPAGNNIDLWACGYTTAQVVRRLYGMGDAVMQQCGPLTGKH